MAKANVSRQALVEAIAALEAQRGSGEAPFDRAVETALHALRDRLAAIHSTPDDHQQRQLAVLVADLSGFTALSERMDAEQVRDALNAMWRVLDPVIAAYGGQIDQHAGDSLLALFGLPQPRLGDATRALGAALTLQAELALFNERVREAAAGGAAAHWAGGWPGPSMRIGVHSGPVYFARAAGSGRLSAVGETIAIARRLERAAPPAQVLASAAVYRQAQAHFQLEPAQPQVAAAVARGAPENVYLATGERMEVPAFSPALVAGQITRLIGRTAELDQLELALQATIDSAAPQVVSVVGAAGVGKSRLVHEFEGRARLLSGSVTVLRGNAQALTPEAPYALVRDLLLRRLNIRPQHSRYVVADRIRRVLGALDRPEHGRRRLSATGPLSATQEVLGQLLNARAAAHLGPDEVLAVVEGLLRAITASGPAILILEGVHRADAESLDLVARLVDAESLPVLVLAIASSEAGGIPRLAREDDPFSPLTRLVVPPLTSVESRLMATDILSQLAPTPMRLLDLIVAESGGNPLYIEAFTRLLMERGVIATGERWRVDMARAESMRLPSGLPELMTARVQELPELERRTLQLAAVIGPLFWDAVLLESRSPALGDTSEPEIDAALLSLEMRRLCVRDATYSLAAMQAYAFRREALYDAVYRALPADERQAQHQRVAHWLIANQDDGRFSARLSVDAMIASHFAAAGETNRASVWQRRAAPPAPSP